jgi:hypothetical protein
MTSRWRSEDGWTVVTAIILMTVMLGAGLATATMVDTQAKQSAATRQRDTAFNLAEAALNAQVYALSLRWPGYGYNAAPAYAGHACSNAGAEPVAGARPVTQQEIAAATPLCPSPATLAPLLNNTDAQGSSSWATWVYDDPSPTSSAADRGKHYSDALVSTGDTITAPAGTVPTQGGVAYDSNKDGKLWIKATATVRGRTRTLVSLVKVHTLQRDVIKTAFMAGSLDFSNNGNHSGYFIDQTASGSPSGITVRCDPYADTSASCLGYPIQGTNNWNAKLGGAIDPPTYSATPGAPNAADAAALDELMQTALADKTHYDPVGPRTCSELGQPPAFDFNVLYIKDCGLISWSSNATIPLEGQGTIILDNTRIRIAGSMTIKGVVYSRRPPATPPAVEMSGCTQIHGGLIVDDLGAATIGSCSQADRPQLLFEGTAFDAFKTYASAGIIKNTWRELTSR